MATVMVVQILAHLMETGMDSLIQEIKMAIKMETKIKG